MINNFLIVLMFLNIIAAIVLIYLLARKNKSIIIPIRLLQDVVDTGVIKKETQQELSKITGIKITTPVGGHKKKRK